MNEFEENQGANMKPSEMSDHVSNRQPSISVVIPVFNGAAFLHDCVASLMLQTLTDAEFIFVDDGSTDNSREIIEKYACQDSRIVSLALTNNLGAFMARKAGVIAARAPCVTFLDPDDTLLPDACKLFVETMRSKSAAIVHCGMKIFNRNDLPKERIDVVEKMVRPQVDQLEGRAIIQAFAIDGKINPGLCGKAYRTSLVRRANEMIPDGRYKRAQDYLVNFVVCCLAESYVSLQERAYCYGYGQGFFGAANRDINYYRTMCTQVDILSPLRSVVERYFPDDGKVIEALQVVEDRLIGGSYSQIFTLLDSPKDKKDAFSLLLDKAGGFRLTEVLAKRNYANKENLSLMLGSLDALSTPTSRAIHKVGIFYYHLTPGGVQRVITTLINVYKTLGCEVVLFLEKHIDGSCFDVASEVQIEYLPVVAAANRGEIGVRLQFLMEAIARHGIDLLYYHAFLSPNILWDLLVCKWVCHIPVIIHYHTATCYRPRSATETYSRWPGFMKLLSFADGVVVLSRADEWMLRLCGVKAKYIPNPVPFECASEKQAISTVKNEIVWIARFSREKHPSDPVKILAAVREHIPDAQLTIVGGGPNVFLKEVKATIEKLGLSHAVTIAGEHKDVRPYYERASVYLHTSNLEGFPMSLIEAASFGLPTVMYELPWLEIVRDNSGIVQVPQSDLKAAASAIVSILSSPEKVSAMARANREKARKFASYDFVNEWRSILSCIERGITFGSGVKLLEEDLCALSKQVMHCYARGICEEQIVRSGCEKERLRLSSIVQKRDAETAKLRADVAKFKSAMDATAVQCKNDLLAKHKENVAGTMEVARLKADIAKLKSASDAASFQYKKSLREERKKFDASRKEICALKTSEAYRVGMFVTWPARKIWGGVKCLRENGLRYTLKHFVGKVLRLFGSKVKW